MKQVALLSILGPALAFAQLSFEVASLKPSPPVPPTGGVYFGPPRGGPGTPEPNQITWTYVTLRTLLMTAYNMETYQVTGPAWLDTERYDILAKLPADSSKEQASEMWQTLLTERFGLALHHESKEFQIEELVVAKGGPKFKETTLDLSGLAASGPPQLDKNRELIGPGLVTMIAMGGQNGGNAHATAKAQPLSKLTSMMTAQLKRPVVDKTGLTGKYDFTLDFTVDLTGIPLPPGGPAPSPADSATTPGPPDIAAAVQQQLGLRLVPAKAKLDTVIIDRAEKVPTAN